RAPGAVRGCPCRASAAGRRPQLTSKNWQGRNLAAVSEVVDAYFAAWKAPDPTARMYLLERSFADQGVLITPRNGRASGPPGGAGAHRRIRATLPGRTRCPNQRHR